MSWNTGLAEERVAVGPFPLIVDFLRTGAWSDGPEEGDAQGLCWISETNQNSAQRELERIAKPQRACFQLSVVTKNIPGLLEG